MKINGTEYTMPELNFNTMCKLEDMGVSLTGNGSESLNDGQRILSPRHG